MKISCLELTYLRNDLLTQKIKFISKEMFTKEFTIIIYIIYTKNKWLNLQRKRLSYSGLDLYEDVFIYIE